MTPSPVATSDLDTEIDAALSQLGVSIDEAKHHSDPLWMPLSALSAFLRSMRGLHGDFITALQINIKDAKHPVQDDVIRRAVAQGVSGHAGALVNALAWRNLLFGIFGGILLVTVAFASGYWFRGTAPILVGVHAGAEKCEDRTDGSRLCWIPVFERLPAINHPR